MPTCGRNRQRALDVFLTFNVGKIKQPGGRFVLKDLANIHTLGLKLRLVREVGDKVIQICWSTGRNPWGSLSVSRVPRGRSIMARIQKCEEAFNFASKVYLIKALQE